MISFCTTVKNRSRVEVEGRELLLFPNCVRSIQQAVPRNLECELVVTDWQSDDWPLHEWISETAAPIPITLIEAHGPFSRGRGLNIAAHAAKGDLLFFLDADALLSLDLVEACVSHANADRAYFPILFSFDDPAHLSGHWVDFGYGHCALKTKLFQRTAGWPEYKSWGGEDDDFYADVAARASVRREQVPGFYHQWHPDDLLWKNRYSERHPQMAQEFRQRKNAIDQLCVVIPEGNELILVDEARFGSDPIANRRSYPFLERNDEYFGPPPDDVTAIQELVRLRENGASYIAFAWMAFWWLDYYGKFNKYLRSTYPIVLSNENLLVFDLRATFVRRGR